MIGDFLTPYVLGLFYPELNQMKSVISLFGDVGSPVRSAFLIWSVIAGVFYCLSLPAIFCSLKPFSRFWAWMTVWAIGFYGIGDCIFTGLFSVDTEQAGWNLSTWVHNIGSGLGYAGFLLFPLILFLLYRTSGNETESKIYLRLLIASLIFAAVYGLARIPGVRNLEALSALGFWQRVSFLFNYIPIAVFAIRQLRRVRRRLNEN